MQLEELKEKIVDEIGMEYDEKANDFTKDIYECKNGWDLVNTLEWYGYDKQGSLDILFSILIK